MSVLISGVLMNPAGVPVSGAEVTFSALTNGPSVLNGFSASVMTDQDGNYAIPLEICDYAISIQSDGYNSVYGSVSINEKSTPATINELLKLAAMEQAVTPAIIVYFREIQADVAVKLVTVQTLSNNATTAARDATTARNEAAQYAQNLSTALAQAQQASTSATASANMATQSANKADSAKNAAEAAAGNAQATLTDVMKKSANGADIADAAQFRNNVGLKNAATHDVQTSATDATAGLVLKIANNGEGPFGLGSRGTILNTTDVVVQLRSAVNGWYRCAVNTVRAPSTGAWTFLVMKWDDNTRCVIAISTVTGQGVQFITIGPSTDSGWMPLWGSNNLSLPLSVSNGGSGKNAGAFANGPNTQTPQALADFLSSVDNYGNNSAGSVSINNDGGSWHSYLSVRHRSGINDGNNYGWLLEDRSMTSAAYDFYIRKRISTGWMEPVALWHSQNLVKQSAANAADGEVLVAGMAGGIGKDRGYLIPNATLLSDFRINGGWYAQGLQQTDAPGSGHVFNIFTNPSRNYGIQLWCDYRNGLGDFRYRTIENNNISSWNGFVTTNSVQTITAEKAFSAGMRDERSTYGRTTSPPPVLLSSIAQLNNMRIGDVLFMNCTGSLAALVPQTSGYFHIYCVGKADNTAGGGSFIACQLGIAHNMFTGSLSGGSSITWRRALYAGYNAVADSGGFWKTASPVISIYSDGSFTTTDEADGVNVERLSEGVYKITGCLGLNADRAWGGDEGGVDVPMCRNKLPRLWVDYGGDDGSSRINADGSIVIRTYHRPHPDAPVFARNEIDGYTDGAPIDIPSDTFISVRVQMPSREELKPQVMHSNVYSGTVSIAGAISQ
ncbi:hypothetical protein PEC730217_36630 [Pectobacterium carotovorum subsp. carotovorum]|nr:hypothetical protein PEC730217_36630 [Pectobacterium carotovorum subsp. carotovorum]